MLFRALVICGLVAVGGLARAETGSLFAAARPGQVIPAGATTRASLFTGTRSGSLFAPRPVPPTPVAPPLAAPDSPEQQLLALIARAEAGPQGYDAVQHGARVGPTRPPTDLTLAEIYAWIEATPGQPHAIGRYQFIPATLRRLARVEGLGPETRFSPAIQDGLALRLLDEAGLPAFRAGTLPRAVFMRNLARIWAGLPLPDGRSYYEGHAGNRATMSWAAFEDGMEGIWPVGG